MKNGQQASLFFFFLGGGGCGEGMETSFLRLGSH